MTRIMIRLLVWIMLLAIPLAFGVVPLLVMIAKAISVNGPSDLLGDVARWNLLGRSAALATGSAFGATLIGTTAGWLIGSTEWKGKGWFRAFLVLPLAIPPYLHGIGWTTLLSPDSRFTLVIEALIGAQPSEISQILYSFAGAVFFLSLAYFPVSMLFCEKSLAQIDYSLVETAQISGANWFQTWRYVYWPLLKPGLITAWMITFILSVADLGVPTLLKVPVFNFEVFIQLGAFNDFGSATLLAMPLVALGLIVVIIERRVTFSGLEHNFEQEIGLPKAKASRVRLNMILLFCLGLLTFILPLGAIVIRAADIKALREMWQLARTPALITIQYAGLASFILTFLAISIAWNARCNQNKHGWWIDWPLAFCFAVPGTILALAIQQTWGNLNLPHWVTPSLFVIMALVVRYAIIGQRVMTVALARLPNSILEAAALDGANQRQLIWFIIFPMLKIAILAAVVISYIVAASEIGSTILLYPPGKETLLIALYSIEANSPRSFVAAMIFYQLVLTLLPIGSIFLFSRELIPRESIKPSNGQA